MINRFNRCLVIINTKSTSSQDAVEQLPVLNEFFAQTKIKKFILQKTDFETNDRLKNLLKDYGVDDLIVLIGGDGTINQIITTLLSGNVDEDRLPTVLPLKGGNASDIAHMMHGKSASDLKEIMKNGSRSKAYALSLQSDDETVKYVLAYASFGASAHVMEVVDGLGRRLPLVAKYRALHHTVEVFLSLFGLITARRFEASLQGNSTTYYDILFVNGSRIAKYYQTKARLTDGDFVRLSIRHKHPLLFWHLMRLLQHNQRNKTTNAAQTIQFAVAVPAQIDGEVYEVPANTTITVAREVQPYYVLKAR